MRCRMNPDEAEKRFEDYRKSIHREIQRLASFIAVYR
jgi:hypothetical protein